MRVAGKVAVITGAGGGIGRATAELLASEGAKVLGGDLSLDGMEAVIGAVKEAGGEMSGFKANVASKQDCEALIDEAVKRYGKIDILVNNAGVMDHNHGVNTVADAMWERVFAINVNGPMYTSRRAVQLMLESGGGAIVNVASTASMNGSTAGVAYTSSKHAIVGLTRSIAWHYAQRGIRCNAICPGGTMTNIVKHEDIEKWDQEGAARIGIYHQIMPMVMEPVDHARAILFLASDEAAKINGAIIPVDGGWLTA